MLVLLLAVLAFSMCTSVSANAAKPSWYQANIGRKTLAKGEKLKITFTNTSKVTYRFTSSNKSVIKVGKKSGVIKALKKGKAYITITATRKKGKKKQVFKKKIKIEVYNLKRSGDKELSLVQSTGKTLKLKGMPNWKKRNIVWSTSDVNIVSVADTGKIKAMGPGTATVSAVYENCLTFQWKVTVTAQTRKSASSVVLINKIGSYAVVSLDQLFEDDIKTKVTGAWYTVTNPSLGGVSGGRYSAYNAGTNVVVGHFGPYVKNFIIRSIRWNAHRGLLDLAPENTVQAYEKAALAGAYSIECDVQVTSDGEFVLYHDHNLTSLTDTTATTTAKKRIGGNTLAEVRALNIVKGNGITAGIAYKIPTLDEYLTICKRYGCIADIELKAYWDDPITYNSSLTAEEKAAMKPAARQALMQKLYQKIAAHGMLGQTVISTFSNLYVTEFYNSTKNLGYVLPIAGLDADSVTAAKQCGFPGNLDVAPMGVHQTCDWNPVIGQKGISRNTYRS